ncbi:LemA family protein [Longimicrobium terrae]|uniref:LemA protein n=1 Tax=Longimicrobium terrae TaxID=1639882 RepID=A0A841H0H3_9BACT|nr:LemA family protein [Longimicrobium terrae]MBB4637219.1 LemA protein [Longimicrobium terrae]MBB6071520.1 LemA protein [Longimicrobium terrae]NNC30058.1 LemA family protein [Longimicrobium terrae]
MSMILHPVLEMTKMRITRSVIAFTLALSLGGCGYNRIQELDEAAERSKSDIGVALQNRNQLIPNLVATVKGAAEFERGTYTDVAKARAGQSVAAAEQQLAQTQQQLNQAVQSRDVAQMQKADDAVRAQIGTFINVAREAYPNLSATKNFQGLQDQLAESENKIAVARQDYNQSVQQYNTYIRSFPQVITARASGAKRKEPYQAPANAEQAPNVDFGAGK